MVCLYGFFAAGSVEREEKWLLVTLVWVLVLPIFNGLYFLIRYFRDKKETGA
jgi:heme/copper-type cytochrome/quinol oxidase subunit 2